MNVLQFAVLGLGLGAVYALLGNGLVLIYRGSGVLNFAHGAFAMVGAYAFWQCHFVDGWAFAPAFAVAVIGTGILGALTHMLIMRRLRAASPLVLYFDPTLFGLVKPWVTSVDFMRQVAKIWLFVGIGGLLFRTVQLFFIRDVETGLVWMTKILTDPFNDFKIYCKAPLALMRGELIDPGLDIIEHNSLVEEHA